MSQLALYLNKSDSRQLNKTFTRVKTYEDTQFKIVDNTNVLEPIILLKSNFVSENEYRDFTKINYAYLSSTVRYYFVNDIVMRNGSLIELHLKVDVLQSFASYISNVSGLVERQEFINSPYFIDNQMPIKSGRIIERVDFPTIFSNNLNDTSDCITLTVNGG